MEVICRETEKQRKNRGRKNEGKVKIEYHEEGQDGGVERKIERKEFRNWKRDLKPDPAKYQTKCLHQLNKDNLHRDKKWKVK